MVDESVTLEEDLNAVASRRRMSIVTVRDKVKGHRGCGEGTLGWAQGILLLCI